MTHDGDHVDYADVVLGPIEFNEARERVRLGIPPNQPCARTGCAVPAVANRPGAECGSHDREVNRMLDDTWPPTVE